MVGTLKRAMLVFFAFFVALEAGYSSEKTKKVETKAEKDRRIAYEAEGCNYLDIKQRTLMAEMFGDYKDYKSPKFCLEAYDYMKTEYGEHSVAKTKVKSAE